MVILSQLHPLQVQSIAVVGPYEFARADNGLTADKKRFLLKLNSVHDFQVLLFSIPFFIRE